MINLRWGGGGARVIFYLFFGVDFGVKYMLYAVTACQ